MTIYTHTDLIIFDSDIGAEIKVANQDFLVKATCDDATGYGKIDFTMDAETAIAFGEALIKQAKIIKENKNEG